LWECVGVVGAGCGPRDMEGAKGNMESFASERGVKDAAIHATAAWKAGTLGKQSRGGPMRGEARLCSLG